MGPFNWSHTVDWIATILIVDDTRSNRQILLSILKDRGYHVRGTSSGKSALSAARRSPPDLILLDIEMPEMNGFDVCEQLKSDVHLRSIPVIFISALSESLDKVKAFGSGGVDYVTKPFEIEELLARVEAHLRIARLQAELEKTNKQLRTANARVSRDLKLAATIQQAFLPSRSLDIPGLEFGWVYKPRDELAGDGLNIIPLGNDQVAIYVLDVSGHGIASSLLSVTLSRLLTPTAGAPSVLVESTDGDDSIEAQGPAEVVNRLNRLFPLDANASQYATMVYGILDTRSGKFRYVSAGHPGPIHLRSGHAPECLKGDGFPIGVTMETYSEQTVELQPGDRLYLYTDGIPEAMNPARQLFSIPRLMDILEANRHETLDTGIDTVIQQIMDWHESDRPQDDISLLAIELMPIPTTE